MRYLTAGITPPPSPPCAPDCAEGVPAAVLFDLDGTLADTAPELHAAANAALAELEIMAVPFGEAREYIGDGMPRFIKRLITRQWWGEPAQELYQHAEQRLAHHYQRLCVNSRLYDGAAAALAQLAQREVPMACVTNKAQRFTVPLLAACGVAEHFAAVVCGDTLPVKKPAPDPLHAAMRALNVAPEETVMVGDSITASRASAAAGCKFICMTYGYHRENKIPPADAQAADFAQMLDVLDALDAL